MKKVAGMGLCLLWAVSFLLASEPEVRVLITYTKNKIQIESDNRFYVSNGHKRSNFRGKTIIHIENRNNELVCLNKSRQIIMSGENLTLENRERNGVVKLKNVPYGIGWWWAGTEDRIYPDVLEFYPNKMGAVNVVNILPIEEYLLGVVPSEIGVNSPMEALKAQTVCARSEAVKGLETGQYMGPNYDLTSDVMCQVYSGLHKTNDRVRKAVKETAGEVLSYDGKVINAYYASNCGGFSENIENVWPDRSGSKPYWSGNPDSKHRIRLDLTQPDDVRKWIESEPDVWCAPSQDVPAWSKRYFRWKDTTEVEKLSRRIAQKNKNIGILREIIPLNRGVSGRITDCLFVGDKGHIHVEGELAIRQIWDPPLRSSCFVEDRIGSKKNPKAFVVSGAGWGHGVGMCQTGAISQANSGRNYKKILRHYFRKSKIIKRY